jgi:hypothetical protein
VYINEVASGTRPIEGVGTAMAAFVGFAPAGPANTPTLITSWSQYVDTFGAEENGRRNPHMPDAFLSHAVYGYFLNGGGRCYVDRVVVDGDGASTKSGSTAKLGAHKPKLQLPGRSAKALASLEVTPKDANAGEIEISISAPVGDDQPEGTFTLGAKKADISETFENVTLARRGGKNVVETVNQTSRLITITELQTAGSLVERTPSLGTYTLKPTSETTTAMTAPVKATHFVGDVSTRTGLEGLEVAEDATMICCPDLMSAYRNGAIDRDGVKAVQLAMIAHCERMGDRMAILDPLPDLSAQEAKKWREKEAGYDSKYAALYYPWISIAGPDGRPVEVPPSGHIAGIYARNDNERGVHKAPANEVVRGALNPVMQVTTGEQAVLNPAGVNAIRSFTGRGVRVWGARTLSSDPQWRYINVRRLFNYVEESIEQGTQWVVFEPNDADLWARVRRDVGAFLTGVWRDGMLFGATPAEAFFVKCDAENNPEDVRDRGQLVIDVGLAPVKPAEFVIFRFTQFSGGGA